MSFIPVILSGGAGTRLWPVSRTKYPKQFCELLDQSLFDLTLQRLQKLGSPWVVTNEALRVLTHSALQSAGVSGSQALYEPLAKNTAPAIAFLCKVLALQGRTQDVVGIFPSDHVVEQTNTFEAAVRLAVACAQDGKIVTLGIQPTFPATGYGYIEVDRSTLRESSGLSAHPVISFREKPNAETAQEFIRSETFFWNAGIFVFQVATVIEHFKRYLPETWALIDTLDPSLHRLQDVYQRCPAQSFDYGIMEKVKDQACIPCDLGWSDVGSWDELAKLRPSAPKFEIGSNNNSVFSKAAEAGQKAIGLVDVEDLIIVETPDAILISKKGSTQKVKNLLESLPANWAVDHPFEVRPWGRFEILKDTDAFKSKVIHVNPGQQLSYQSHAKRSEHWVITRGHPEVVLDDQIHQLQPGQNIYIPQGAKHRIRNPHPTERVEFVEVQVGTYFGEDDIVRYQDDYKRV